MSVNTSPATGTGEQAATCAALLALGAELADLMERLTRRFGSVSLVQYRALSLLADGHPEPLEPWELAEGLGTGSNHVTMVLDQLERQGLVERSPHPSDGRRRLVRLTPTGTERITALEPQVRLLERRIVGATLTAAEQDALQDVSLRLRAAINELRVTSVLIRPGP